MAKINNEKLFQKRIVVLGGGTGPFNLLRGLIKVNQNDLITSIPTTWDSGKSSGILRTELGILPPGDPRRHLIALINDDERREIALELFERRVKGHAVGNLLLASLDQAYNGAGLDAARKLLNVQSEILPVSLNQLTLVFKDQRGIETYGEHFLDSRGKDVGFDPKNRISSVYFSKPPRPNPRALAALKNADIVVLSMGSLFGSVVPHLMVPGVADAINESKAKLVYVLNIMTESGQTDHYKASDHIGHIVRGLGNPNRLNYMIANDNNLPKNVLKIYKNEMQEPIVVDSKKCKKLAPKLKIIKAHVAKYSPINHLLRHDPETLSQLILNLD